MIWLLLPTWNVPLNVYLFAQLRALRFVSPRPAMYLYLSFRRQLVKNQAFCFHSGPPTSPLRSICFLVGVALADRFAGAIEAEADAREHAILVRGVDRPQVVGNVVGHRGPR